MQTLEAIELACFVASFEEPVCIEGEVITRIKLQRDLIVVRVDVETEGQRSWNFECAPIEKRRRMTGARQSASAEPIDPGCHARHKTVLHLTAQAVIDLGQQRPGLR